MSLLGHFGGPEWEYDGGGFPPRCKACGYHHEPTDPCPIHEPDPVPDPAEDLPVEEEEAPFPEEPEWVAEGYATEPESYPYQPDPPAPRVPSELEIPPFLPDEPITYEKPAYRYSSVMYRSES